MWRSSGWKTTAMAQSDNPDGDPAEAPPDDEGPEGAPHPGDLEAFEPAPFDPSKGAARYAGEAAHPDAVVELNALLGRGTHYTGRLHFDGRVRIEGRFEGEIFGDGVLVIGPGAEVDGSIEVGVCIVAGGSVRANVRARDAIELHAPAVVLGDLHAPNVFIDRGVQFEGNCRMAPLDEQPQVGATPADDLDGAGERDHHGS
jgi:cytoskeletal protein CcmA (bactofilin family)